MKRFKKIYQSFRASTHEPLPFNSRFWLAFFCITTFALALSTGFFMVKLEKIEQESQSLCQEKS